MPPIVRRVLLGAPPQPPTDSFKVGVGPDDFWKVLREACQQIARLWKPPAEQGQPVDRSLNRRQFFWPFANREQSSAKPETEGTGVLENEPLLALPMITMERRRFLKLCAAAGQLVANPAAVSRVLESLGNAEMVTVPRDVLSDLLMKHLSPASMDAFSRFVTLGGWMYARKFDAQHVEGLEQDLLRGDMVDYLAYGVAREMVNITEADSHFVAPAEQELGILDEFFYPTSGAGEQDNAVREAHVAQFAKHPIVASDVPVLTGTGTPNEQQQRFLRKLFEDFGFRCRLMHTRMQSRVIDWDRLPEGLAQLAPRSYGPTIIRRLFDEGTAFVRDHPWFRASAELWEQPDAIEELMGAPRTSPLRPLKEQPDRVSEQLRVQDQAAQESKASEQQGTETTPPQEPPAPQRALPKTAVVFPPAGSHFAGMGKDLYERYPVARDIYDRANVVARRFLGEDFDIRTVSFEGGETLERGGVETTLAITVHQCALWEVLKQERGIPELLAGESRGSMAAYYASGMLTLEEAIELSIRHAQFIVAASARQGTRRMAVVIGKPIDEVEPMIKEHGGVITVDEAPGLMALGAPDAHMQAIHGKVTGRGVKFVRSKALYATHDPHNVTAETADLLAPYLQFLSSLQHTLEREGRAPRITVLSTVRPGEVLRTPADMVREETESLDHTIRWRETVKAIEEQGIRHIIQLGGQKPFLLPYQKKHGWLSSETRVSHLGHATDLDAIELGVLVDEPSIPSVGQQFGEHLERLRTIFHDAGFGKKRTEWTIAQMWLEPASSSLSDVDTVQRLMTRMAEQVVRLRLHETDNDGLHALLVMGNLFCGALRHRAGSAVARRQGLDGFERLMRHLESRDALLALAKRLHEILWDQLPWDDEARLVESLAPFLSNALPASSRAPSTPSESGDLPRAPPAYTVTHDPSPDPRTPHEVRVVLTWPSLVLADGRPFSAYARVSLQGDTMMVKTIQSYDGHHKAENLSAEQLAQVRHWNRAVLAEAIRFADARGATRIVLTPPVSQYQAWGLDGPNAQVFARNYVRLPYEFGFALRAGDPVPFNVYHGSELSEVSPFLPVDIQSHLRWESTMEELKSRASHDLFASTTPDSSNEPPQPLGH